MRQVAVMIWIIFAIVGAGASILLTLDMFRLRDRMGRFWGAMLAGDAVFTFSLILAIVMSRRGASTFSVIAGLSLLLLAQALKTACAGACALHMRANINGSHPPQTQEAKHDNE